MRVPEIRQLLDSTWKPPIDKQYQESTNPPTVPIIHQLSDSTLKAGTLKEHLSFNKSQAGLQLYQVFKSA